jgi:hypothetical protein
MTECLSINNRLWKTWLLLYAIQEILICDSRKMQEKTHQ